MSVWLSAMISPEPHARPFTNFSVRVAYGRGSVLRQGGEIPKGRGKFKGCPVHSKALAIFAAADNVVWQKGSLSMPGKRKEESGKFCAQAMRPIGREGVMGVHSAGEV